MKGSRIIYGTAWKKEQTAALVRLALGLGYRNFDTAGMAKHYHQAGVGEALRTVERASVWIQTKYSPFQRNGVAPYDEMAALGKQVDQSLSNSLADLQTSYVDSLLLHCPMQTMSDTLEVWRGMEAQVSAGRVLSIGISNMYSLDSFRILFEQANVKPSALQNRFYQDTGYDKELRAYCREKGVDYQSFWTLTANPHLLRHPAIVSCAREHNKTSEQVLFRYLTQVGVVPLTGSQSPQHLSEDLSIFSWALPQKDFSAIAKLLS